MTMKSNFGWAPLGMALTIGLVACGKKEPTQPTAATTAQPTAATTAAATAEDATATTAAPAEDAAGTSAAPADAAPVAPSEACVAAGEITIDHVSLSADGGTVHACGELDERTWCYRVGLADGALKAEQLGADDLSHVGNAPGPIDDPFRRREGEPTLQLCRDAATGCKDVFVGDVMAAWMGADGRRFALATLEEKSKRVRVFDAETLAEVGNHVVASDVDLPDCSFAAPLGDAVLVATGPCVGSAGRKAWLIDGASGQKIADVGGGPDFDARLGGFVKVGDDRWAIRDGGGKRVVIQDVKSGEVAATVDLSELPASEAGAWMFMAGEPARLVLVENRPTPGASVIVDPASGKIDKQVAPDPCKP
ncbi:MAG: hypothetical protein IT385_12295 [Deltaproteobacteria bacterium]|nr:hypothetical protein [Deltaproteobacteria bacterium]